MEERLQKIMAHAGLGSRRENEKLIAAGRVRVNGRVAKLGDKADPEKDSIVVDGRRLSLEGETRVYIALHKPKGVISSLEDELDQGRRTVRDLVDIPGHLYPVGRLDKQSTGLMLMTNDGQLTHRLTHPRYGHKKTYAVVVEGRIAPEQVRQWRQGVWLDGKKTAPAEIKVKRHEGAFTRLLVVMREGRKRQIRRIASMLGHPVRHLVREKIGPIALGDLKPGEWRFLSAQEIDALKKATRSGKKSSRRKPANRPTARDRHRSGRKSPDQRGKV